MKSTRTSLRPVFLPGFLHFNLGLFLLLFDRGVLAGTIEFREGEVTALTPGTTQTETIHGEESRYFSLELTGETAHTLTLRQRGIDLVVILHDADENELFGVDNPIGKHGPELLILPAGLKGSFMIEVKPKMEGDRGGDFVIELTPRWPSGSEQNRQKAELATETGGRYFFQNTREARERALAQFEAALPLWENAGEKRWRAITLFAIGRCAGYTRDWQRAERAYRRSLVLWQEPRDLFQQAHTLNNLARSIQAQRRVHEALPLYQKAALLFREVNDPSWLASVFINIGSLYESLGEPDQEERNLREALKLFHQNGDRRREAWCLNNLGAFYRRTGEWQKAFSSYRKALEAARNMADHLAEARILNNFGAAYMRFGDPRMAASLFESALPLRREVQDRNGELVSMVNLAWAQGQDGKTDQALASFRQAIAMSQKQKRTAIQAAALDLMGALLTDLGRFGEALPPLKEAGQILAKIGNRGRQANNFSHMGHLYLGMGQPRRALEHLDRALALFGNQSGHAKKAETLLWKARARWMLGMVEEAGANLSEAAEIVESQRGRIGSHDLRTSYFANQQNIYACHVELLMDRHRLEPLSGFAEKAWRIHERARAQGLLEMLTHGNGSQDKTRDPASRTKREVLLRELHAKTQLQLARIGKPEDTNTSKTLQRDIQELLLELRGLDSEWEAANPRRTSLTHPPSLDVSEIRGLLDSQTVLLEYFLGEPQGYVWAIGTDFFFVYSLPERKQIERLTREVFQEMANAGSSGLFNEGSAATRLSRLLLGPLASHIRQKRLAIVADGPLHMLPFAALPAPTREPNQKTFPVPLLAHHAITMLPSASVLAIQRRSSDGRHRNQRMAILADPVFSPTDSRFSLFPPRETQSAREPETSDNKTELLEMGRLPATQDEALAIANLAGLDSCMLALGFDASRELVLSGKLQSFSYLHFATHGLFNSNLPELSGIILSSWSPKGHPREAFLGLPDVHNLELSAELVVLSGCQTALGREMRGEGVLGLTRGFQYAGAKRVVASLWRVPDKATAALMRSFYREIFKNQRTPSDALRLAQLEIRAERRWRHPYFWAAFVHVGDWN